MVFIETGKRNKGTIIEKKKFKKLQAIIEEWINSNIEEPQTDKKEENETNDAKKLMRQNINSLNRIPFKALISDFCKEINCEVSEEHIQLFIKCRNKLVHTGNFYCRTANSEEKEKYPQLKNELSEYYFLVNFISKLILKIFGYNGIYLDWGYTEGPISRELL
jgi:hypothetical protein